MLELKLHVHLYAGVVVNCLASIGNLLPVGPVYRPGHHGATIETTEPYPPLRLCGGMNVLENGLPHGRLCIGVRCLYVTSAETAVVLLEVHVYPLSDIWHHT